jgi:hypothetical protein
MMDELKNQWKLLIFIGFCVGIILGITFANVFPLVNIAENPLKGCLSPYDETRNVPAFMEFQADGRPMGYDGRGITLDNGHGWGAFTKQDDGKWVLTPALPVIPGEKIRVLFGSLEKRCIEQYNLRY